MRIFQTVAPQSSSARFRLSTMIGLALFTSTALGLNSCAKVPEAAAPFSTLPSYAQKIKKPTPPSIKPRPPGPCVDPDQTVIGTCLESTGGLVPSAINGTAAYVAERTTGNIMSVVAGKNKKLVINIPVDSSGDGGLIDFTPSPTYDEDRMIYALITTAADNRVIRITPGDTPKPLLVGIPKGANGNMGSLTFISNTELLLATGNAGITGNSEGLAGKLISITNFTTPSALKTRVLHSGLGTNVALCPNNSDGSVWFTSRGSNAEYLYRMPARKTPDADADATIMWTWRDHPGVAGCAASDTNLLVTHTSAKRIDFFELPKAGQVTIKAPEAIDLKTKYGALGRATVAPNGMAQIATVNKGKTKLNKNDDRVFLFPLTNSSGGGGCIDC